MPGGVQQNPAKRLCLENFSSFSWGEEDDNTISMDNSSEVVTKIAGLYAERLMSDVLLIVGEFCIFHLLLIIDNE